MFAGANIRAMTNTRSLPVLPQTSRLGRVHEKAGSGVTAVGAVSPASDGTKYHFIKPVDLCILRGRDDIARACSHGPELQLAADNVPDPFGRGFPLVLVSVPVSHP